MIVLTLHFAGFFYSVDRLALPSGCLGNACVGDTVYPDDLNHKGAEVLAVNSHTQKVTVRSNKSGSTYRYSKNRLALKKGCIEGICVGDTVLPDDLNHRGAIVLAVNPYTQKVTVRSNQSGSTYRYQPYRVAVLDECLDYDSFQRYSYEFKN